MQANTTAQGRKNINQWFKEVTEAEGNAPAAPMKLLVVVGAKGTGKRTLTRAIKDAVEKEYSGICSVFTLTEERPIDVDALQDRYRNSPTILVLETMAEYSNFTSNFPIPHVVAEMGAIETAGIHERVYRELRRQLLTGAGL